MPQVERDFPVGHPAAVDTVMGSPEHKAWLRKYDTSLGERDFPPGHPAAVDTPGNQDSIEYRAGIDPRNPHLQEFTGYTPEKAAAIAEYNRKVALQARESAALAPIHADVANAALEKRRKELGVDVLDAEQHQQVLAALQEAAKKA